MIFCFPTWNHRWETKKTYFPLNPVCLKGILTKMVYDNPHITGSCFIPQENTLKNLPGGRLFVVHSSGGFGQFSFSRPSNELVALGSGALGVLSCADLPKVSQGGWMWVEKNQDMSGSWKLFFAVITVNGWNPKEPPGMYNTLLCLVDQLVESGEWDVQGK